MQKQNVRIIIDKEGNYSVQAMEGTEGTSCREKTRDLELVLGGQLQESKNTPDYYKGDGPDINLNLNM